MILSSTIFDRSIRVIYRRIGDSMHNSALNVSIWCYVVVCWKYTL